MPARQNVALLTPSVTASMLAQFVSLLVAPGGIGVPAPLRYSLSTHTVEHMRAETLPGCVYEQATASGDGRAALSARHPSADAARETRTAGARRLPVRAGRAFQYAIEKL